MSVALLRRSIESLEKWSDSGIAFGLPPIAACKLQEASLDIEGYLLTGGSNYTAALKQVPNAISQALEYVDPGTSLASEMRELHSTIKVYIERACPKEKAPDGREEKDNCKADKETDKETDKTTNLAGDETT